MTELTRHVDGHFSAEQTPVSEHSDTQLAMELDIREKQAAKLQEEKEFKTLQDEFGMAEDQGGYRKQAEKSLERAVCDGQLSIADYYTHRYDTSQAVGAGIDDGNSCTKGVIDRLNQYYACMTGGTVANHWLCSYSDHYSASYGDKGWGCGYRNLQMILSSLKENPRYEKVLFNGRPLIPSIPKIQRLIEAAWQKGFDVQGCEQLGGELVNSSKWIGATEIVAMLSSLTIKCQLVDFHAPSKDGQHPRLFEWVRDYFKQDVDFIPPLYLQHQGHSRTIIGVEETKDGSLRLLIFDPSSSRKQMRTFLCDEQPISANLMRCLRRTPSGMKAKQYQIVAVTGVLTNEGYEECKILKSDRIS